jgi:hypothetical protein
MRVMSGMSGLDELLLVLDWVLRNDLVLPEQVNEAYAALHKRQAEHRGFDDVSEGD